MVMLFDDWTVNFLYILYEIKYFIFLFFINYEIYFFILNKNNFEKRNY